MSEVVAWVPAVASSIAALASTVTAAVAIAYTRRQAMTQIRSHEVTLSLDLVRQFGEAQRRIRDAKDDSVRTFEYRELLNLIEAVSGILNLNLYPDATRDNAKAFLIEVSAWMQASETHSELVKSSVTGGSTFSQWALFLERHKAEVSRVGAAYRKPLNP